MDGVGVELLKSKRLSTSLPALTRFLYRHRPEFVISAPTAASTVAAAAVWLIKGARIRHIVFQADTFSSDVAIEHQTSPKLRALIAVARPAFRRAHGIAACSRGVLAILRNEDVVHARTVDVIPVPVGPLSYHDGVPFEGRLHPWIAERTTPVITSVARLVRRKNFGLLLDALAATASTHATRLVIFGEGPERKSLENRIRFLGLTDRVHLAGYVDDPWPSVGASDLFVMPSTDEAFCIAIVEAMLAGAPVVATDAIGGGPRDILADGKYGTLVPLGDGSALATALVSLLDDVARRRQLSERGRDRATLFAPPEVGMRWRSFLNESLHDSGIGPLPAPKDR